jgi:YD repeat-containing protein
MTAHMLGSIRRFGSAIVAAAFVLVAAPAVHGAPATYEYGTNGRLERIRHTDGTVINYTYDANGNREGWTRTSGPPDTIPPSAPGTPTFSNISMTSATASWTAATDNKGVVGYDYRVNTGSWQSLSNVLSANIAGLSAVTTYTVSVRARDAAGNLGPASSNSFTTPDTAAPSVPSGLIGGASTSGTVTLSWSPSTDNVAVIGYRVYRGGILIGTPTATSYVDAGLAGSTTYSYQVSAFDGAGNSSAFAGPISVTTPDSTAPSTPTGLSAAAVGPSQINLSWSGSSDTGGSGLAGYRIYRGGVHIANTGATNYGDSGLAGSTTYSYNVAAYDGAGNTSGQSNTASATTPAPLTATQSSGVWNWTRRPNGTTIISPNVVVTASGGTGSYTYLWHYVSGDTEISVVNSTSNSARWSRTMPNGNVSYSALWACRVTDTAGAQVYAGAVTVTFTRHTNQ